MSTPILKYGLEYPPGTSPLKIEFQFIKAGGYLTVQGVRCGLGLLEHFLAARRLLWPKRYEHRWTRLIYEEIIRNQITILMGAASCVAGETGLLDPITGQETPIAELCRRRIRPIVMTLEGPRLAEVPFLKGRTELFEICLDNGQKFIASSNHRALTEKAFEPVSCFSVGQPLLAYAGFQPGSSEDTCRSVPIADVRRWWRTTPDFQADYPSGFRSYGVPLHPFSKAYPNVAPSPDDVRTRREYASPPSGGSVPECECSHGGLSSVLLSKHSDVRPLCSRGISAICCASEESSQRDAGLYAPHGQWPTGTSLDLPIGAQTPCSSHNSMVYGMPCREYRVQRAHISSIKSVGVHDYYDVEVPGVHHYFAEGTIHHNTQKTSHAAEWVLIDYWVHPFNTLGLVTTTNIEKLETNIFGELKSLWGAAREYYPWLPGNVVDHKHSIFTDDIESEKLRDRRRGIVGKACYEGKQWIGDSVFVGIKQERVRFIGDELQYMAGTFLRSWNPLFSNPDVKVIGSGNPNHNPDDPLGIAAEPKDGWSSLQEPDKTTAWDTKYLHGRCLNLVGTDSPNFDVPEGQPEPYPRLIGRKFMKRVIHDSGPESPDFYRLVKGVMKFSLAHNRVITRQICMEHKAHEKAEWAGTKRTKIYALDPAYGGGDRCVGGYIEFGSDINGKVILRVNPPRIIQINLKLDLTPEDQIAAAAYNDMSKYGIPFENGFYDAFGRGTLGFAFGRKFGADAPIPVDSGGRPTRRQVREGLMIWDERSRELRLKRCDEHYDRRITEYWFSVRYAIEAEQVRELPEDVAAEGCMREYFMVAGNKIAVETKEDMLERLTRSPDLFDWLAIGVEGARQRGFVIASLGQEDSGADAQDDWLKERVDKHLTLMRSKRIAVTA